MNSIVMMMDTKEKECGFCWGSGWETQFVKPCPECSGTGKDTIGDESTSTATNQDLSDDELAHNLVHLLIPEIDGLSMYNNSDVLTKVKELQAENEELNERCRKEWEDSYTAVGGCVDEIKDKDKEIERLKKVLECISKSAKLCPHPTQAYEALNPTKEK